MSPKPDSTIRLHTDDHGFVWYGDAKCVAQNSRCVVAEFFEKSGLGLADAKAIRLLGTRHNAALIVGLRKALGGGSSIVLASPQICKTKAARHDPSSALHALWQPEASSRMPGSWHPLADYDCGPYAMWAEFQAHHKITERIVTIAQSHPAWRAVSFIPDHGVDSACRLLMMILDPRWYLHPSKPHRFSRLHDYLGLTPKNAKCLLREKEPGKNYERAVATFATWYNLNSVRQYSLGEATDPEHFLWRIFRNQQSNTHGLLAAAKRLVDLIAFVWLDAVKVAQADKLFNPSMFFREANEAAAFQRHTDRWLSV